MAALSRVQISVKEFGQDVDVSESPEAQLMYYLDSICYVLDIDKTERNIRRLRDYRNHSQLTEDEVDQLLIICVLFSPDTLINKCIFQDDDMCGNAMNKFYQLDEVANRFLVTDNIIIGGVNRHVRNILFFRELWRHQCYDVPMEQFQTRIRTIVGRMEMRRRGLPTTNQQAVSQRVPSVSSVQNQIPRSQSTQCLQTQSVQGLQSQVSRSQSVLSLSDSRSRRRNRRCTIS